MKNISLKNEDNSFTYVVIPIVLLDEIIKYIVESELEADGEWGSSRSLEKLIEHNCMPELYYKMLSLKI